MGKQLCKKKGRKGSRKHGFDRSELPTFLCRKCQRVACKKKKLCKPIPFIYE